MKLSIMGLVLGIAIGLYPHSSDASLQERTTAYLTIPDVQVDAKLSLFVYTRAPKNSKVSIALYRTNKRTQESRLALETKSSEGEWLIFDFGKKRPQWGEQVTVGCEVESSSKSDEKIYLFTELSDKAVLGDKLIRNANTRFDTSPVTPKLTSGRFWYDSPWPAEITITLNKVTPNGTVPTNVRLRDSKKSEGVTDTTWEDKDFARMRDGQYEAKVECKEIVAASQATRQKNVYIVVVFNRGIK